MRAELFERGFEDKVRIASYAIGGSTAGEWLGDEDGRLSEFIDAVVNDEHANPIVFFTPWRQRHSS